MDGLCSSRLQHHQRRPSSCSFTSFDHYYTTHYSQKQLEKFSIMARIAIVVTYKLMLLCVLFLNCPVASKFAVYFHRKEFRRKKPLRICPSSYIILLSN